MQKIEAQAKADAQRLQAQTEAEVAVLNAQSAAAAARLGVQAEMESLQEREKMAGAYTAHPAPLRLEELTTLRQLRRNANARLYLDFKGKRGLMTRMTKARPRRLGSANLYSRMTWDSRGSRRVPTRGIRSCSAVHPWLALRSRSGPQ